MLTFLPLLAVAFFVTHVLLIFTSFGKKGYHPRKYLWSHITLWIAGVLVTVFLWQNSGQPSSGIGETFNTPLKRFFPILLAFGLSVIAHIIVRLFILPRYKTAQVKK